MERRREGGRGKALAISVVVPIGNSQLKRELRDEKSQGFIRRRYGGEVCVQASVSNKE